MQCAITIVFITQRYKRIMSFFDPGKLIQTNAKSKYRDISKSLQTRKTKAYRNVGIIGRNMEQNPQLKKYS